MGNGLGFGLTLPFFEIILEWRCHILKIGAREPNTGLKQEKSGRMAKE